MYSGITAVLTTQHEKERVITPTFKSVLNINVALHIADTDQLGTFSGTVPRLGTMQETVLAKARLGMTALSNSFGLASEGAFGPHPSMPWLPCDQEMMVFVDDTQGFYLIETLCSLDTNYLQEAINKHDPVAYDNFCRRVGYPEHGITTKEAADMIILSTDMRAHKNPRRMRVIQQLAEKLANRLKECCPSCQLPGFGLVDYQRGLLCELCAYPTDLVVHEILGCVRCSYTKTRSRSDQKAFADSANCALCNP